jgi:hypothetical protein
MTAPAPSVLPSREGFVHGADEGSAFKRLDQKGDSVQLAGFLTGRGRIVGGDENDRVTSAGLDQTALKVESRHPRQSNVDDETTEVHHRARIEEVLCRHIAPSLESRGSQHSLQRLSHSGVVFHDRDSPLSNRYQCAPQNLTVTQPGEDGRWGGPPLSLGAIPPRRRQPGEAVLEEWNGVTYFSPTKKSKVRPATFR